MKKNCPKRLINILMCWHSQCSYTLKWNKIFQSGDYSRVLSDRENREKSGNLADREKSGKGQGI